jgi:hypothetical protein
LASNLEKTNARTVLGTLTLITSIAVAISVSGACSTLQEINGRTHLVQTPLPDYRVVT